MQLLGLLVFLQVLCIFYRQDLTGSLWSIKGYCKLYHLCQTKAVRDNAYGNQGMNHIHCIHDIFDHALDSTGKFIRGGPLEITGRGGGVKNFQWMNFFFDVKALQDLFSTALLLMLKKCKASHSLITVLLKVTVSLES